MWNYEKRLEYPVNISTPNPKIAQVIITQFGGPDGELSASMRYLSQRYTMPYRNVAALLTDIGREASEMAHFQIYILRNCVRCRQSAYIQYASFLRLAYEDLSCAIPYAQVIYAQFLILPFLHSPF